MLKVEIILPPKLTEIEIEDIIGRFIISSSSIHLNFSFTDFITPFASIVLIQMIEAAIKDGRKVHFILKDNLNRKSNVKPCMFILARLGFFENLPKEVSIYPYKPRVRGNPKGKNESILEVTKIEEQSANDIINKVETAIEVNTDYPKNQKLDICIMVSEMIHNIFDHSKAPKSGIIAVQKFNRLHNMQLTIADSGIGIPTTIRNCEDYEGIILSDYETILESVKKGISSFGKKENRGEGLSRCVDLAKTHKATLYIRSNSGLAYITFMQGKKFFTNSKLLPGTQIFVNFPC